jgi:excisionase family DNA binding protein
MLIDSDQVYSPSEVAKLLRVSPATISRVIRDGKLKAFRVGGQWRILGAELQAYIESQTQSALGR